MLFITGSESYVGTALRKAVPDALGIDLAHGVDIRDPDLVDLIPEGATVVHLAAISTDGACKADPELAYDVNVLGTRNVARATAARNGHLIFASTEWVYDKPLGVYGSGKLKAEFAATSMSLDATILRFGIIYGNRFSGSAVEGLYNQAKTQDVITIGSAKTGRRFIHVDDIVSGILTCVGRKGFETFDLTGDRLITLEDIIKTSARLLDREVSIIETDPDNPSVRDYDNSATKAALGWKPMIDLEHGLRTIS